ncbi:MAG: hypothetical protein NC337_04545 [Roseburia sp.]|nr:hypothetical protein [Roseburia sp.]
MEIVRGWEDVAKIRESSSVVIWGAGRWGRMLLQEIRVNKLKNIWIYDKKDSAIKDMNEHITLEQIKSEIDKIKFIIAVQSEKTANEISEEILLYNNKAVMYRYQHKDYAFLTQRLGEKGFYNGEKMCKPLGDTEAKEMLENKLNDNLPFLCSRWGGVEGEAVYADLAGMLSDSVAFSLKNNAGFYPIDNGSIHKFSECSASAAGEIDVLIAGCWCTWIEDLYKLYSPKAILVTSNMMYPFWPDSSWTRALRGKTVLAIHPFAKLIAKQYVYRSRLFKTQNILPEMNLIVYQAVQSMNGNSEFKSWFMALDKMKNDIRTIDFDIALIGCGAYGMPLGAFIKSELRKKAIHMGGSLQILFGIKGKRWEESGYDYQHKLYNEYWVRPTDDLKPQNYKEVEDGCYW